MKLLKIFIVSLTLISLSTLAKPGITNHSTSIGANDLSFVISASEGHLKQIKSGAYQLSLIDVGPYVTYYTRRPNRSNGLASVSNFVKAWGVGTHNFEQDNPNATMATSNIDGVANKQGAVKIFQLANPVYNGAQGTLNFTLIPVGKNNQIVIKNENFEGISLIIN